MKSNKVQEFIEYLLSQHYTWHRQAKISLNVELNT